MDSWQEVTAADTTHQEAPEVMGGSTAAIDAPKAPNCSVDSAGESGEEADDMTCAICLERTPLVEIALVKGCEHQYCVNCILQWSLCKEWCPQCKHPFGYLLTHKQLDGTITDFLTEESVVLLKRARWFEEYMRTSEKGRAMLAIIQSRGSSNGTLSAAQASTDTAAAAGEELDARDWADMYEDYLDAELEEDEEIESYYFSSAAGRARVVLGNRRWGEGGYMRAGRMYARPVVHTARTPNGGGKGSGGKAGAKASSSDGASSSKHAAGTTPGASSSGAGSSSAAGGAGPSSSSGGGGGSSGGSGSGRSSSRGRQEGPSNSSHRGRASAGGSSASKSFSSSAVAPWLDDEIDLDDEDFSVYDCGDYVRGSASAAAGGGSSHHHGDRSCSSNGGSRSRNGRLTKPQRKVSKGAAVTPAVASAACPVVDTPLGRSPGSSSGFHVGSWGATGRSPNSCGGMWAAAAAAAGTPGTAGSSAQAAGGSTPGSGRRARRNARRAALDGLGDDCD